MLKETFLHLVKEYKADDETAAVLWKEIEMAYSGKKRFYHTLTHLENMLEQLEFVQHQIKNNNCLLFALYYHDVVYNASSWQNEEASAVLAVNRMARLNVPEEIQSNCKAMILSTKKHLLSDDMDTNYFIDADLSILGQDWEIYKLYAKKVRKEYAVYPDIVYKPGRKKVLKHFIEMQHIFKTGEFYNRFERKAKENLNRELSIL
ncbi:MAG: hypothetical protein EOP53_11480 [Sphingobacteriales bacterium]|nr:MAG: hypothetical protein EOP53_11480 [Sphingobacteriales bacterium]